MTNKEITLLELYCVKKKYIHTIDFPYLVNVHSPINSGVSHLLPAYFY